MTQFILRKKTYAKFREDHSELINRYLGISRLERAVEKDSELKTVSVLFGADMLDAAVEVFGPISTQ